jgi:hypothetical protein
MANHSYTALKASSAAHTHTRNYMAPSLARPQPAKTLAGALIAALMPLAGFLMCS